MATDFYDPAGIETAPGVGRGAERLGEAPTMTDFDEPMMPLRSGVVTPQSQSLERRMLRGPVRKLPENPAPMAAKDFGEVLLGDIGNMGLNLARIPVTLAELTGAGIEGIRALHESGVTGELANFSGAKSVAKESLSKHGRIMPQEGILEKSGKAILNLGRGIGNQIQLPVTAEALMRPDAPDSDAQIKAAVDNALSNPANARRTALRNALVERSMAEQYTLPDGSPINFGFEVGKSPEEVAKLLGPGDHKEFYKEAGGTLRDELNRGTTLQDFKTATEGGITTLPEEAAAPEAPAAPETSAVDPREARRQGIRDRRVAYENQQQLNQMQAGMRAVPSQDRLENMGIDLDRDEIALQGIEAKMRRARSTSEQRSLMRQRKSIEDRISAKQKAAGGNEPTEVKVARIALEGKKLDNTSREKIAGMNNKTQLELRTKIEDGANFRNEAQLENALDIAAAAGVDRKEVAEIQGKYSLEAAKQGPIAMAKWRAQQAEGLERNEKRRALVDLYGYILKSVDMDPGKSKEIFDDIAGKGTFQKYFTAGIGSTPSETSDSGTA